MARLKTTKAWIVIDKYSQLADVVAESDNGILVPFFSTEAEANDWRYRANRDATTKAIKVKVMPDRTAEE